MKIMVEISVIIPVYNTEQYLLECLESVIAQTLDDIEIICVNDGSTDKSALILEACSKKDSRIKVLSQENRGLAATRMAGLDVAMGKYVLFVDSDDCIDANACSRLLYLMEKTHVDVLGFSYKTVPDGKTSFYSMRTDEILTPQQLLQSTKKPQASDDMCFVWRYMVRREFLQQYQIAFNPQVRFAEDMIFIMELFAHAQKIYLASDALYYYRTNNQYSIMHDKRYNPYMEKSLSIVYVTKKKIIHENHWDELTPFSFDLAARAVKNYGLMMMENRKAKGEPKEKYIREVLHLPMMQDAMKIVGFKNVFSNWKEYIVYLCMRCCFMPILKRYF